MKFPSECEEHFVTKKLSCGDGGSRTRVRRSGITDIYILSLSLKSRFPESSKQISRKASLIKFRFFASGEQRNYPVVVVALNEFDGRNSINTGC